MSSGNEETDLQHQIENLKQQIIDLGEALLNSEEKFRTLTDSAPVGIFLDDTQGKAIFVNTKCAELVGVPAEKALNFGWKPYLHPDDRERMVSEWERAFENNTEFRLEYRWLHEDGKVVWTLGEVVPIIGENGQATLFIGTLTDITSRKQAELEREKLQAQLIQAQRMESVGRLAGGVAHDYNNMLQVIVARTEMAMNGLDPSGFVHDQLQEVLKAAEHSVDITRQLLTFARKQIMSPKVFDINDSVEEMLKMLRHLIGENIDLTWLPREGRMPVKMDPSQLHQILMNLCINARDAIDSDGEITIETAMVTVDETYCAEHIEAVFGEFILLSVNDNGIGMDKATLEKIFEPFFTTKDKGKGTGLGLSTVYGMVKQNGGFIDVCSEPGMGTTFRVYLPLYAGPIVEDETSDTTTLSKGHGETILVVEDDVMILHTVQCMLKDLGYKVLTASTLSEALRLASHYEKEINLLVTDVIMPEINGRDLAHRLRSHNPDMKCLYMSGHTDNVIADQGVLKENAHFIQKPFKARDLVAKVQEALNSK